MRIFAPHIHFLQFRHHFFDQDIRPTLKSEDALAHKIGKYDSIGDGRIIDVGAIGIGNRFHQ